MNRELKVPAALAILVAGFAAMVYWCGKQEENPTTETVQADFADVDIEIKDRPQKPHLTGLESSEVDRTDEIAAGRVSRKSDQQEDRSSVDQAESWWNEMRDEKLRERGLSSADSHTESGVSRRSNERPLISSRAVRGKESHSPAMGAADSRFLEKGADFLNDRDEELYRESTFDRGSVPDPIQTSQSAQTGSSERERLNQDWQVADVKDSNGPKLAKRELPLTHEQTYVIQPGDTLSRIARQFLGADHRAGEIYEANRDVLSDPNNLRVGTQIVIPAGGQRRAPKDGVKSDGPVAGNDGSPESRQAQLRNSLFRPVSGSPFTYHVQQTNSLPENTRTQQTLTSVETVKYTVQRGDSLERIALKHYGSRQKAQEIYEANADQLSSPNAIREGMSLVLP